MVSLIQPTKPLYKQLISRNPSHTVSFTSFSTPSTKPRICLAQLCIPWHRWLSQMHEDCSILKTSKDLKYPQGLNTKNAADQLEVSRTHSRKTRIKIQEKSQKKKKKKMKACHPFKTSTPTIKNPLVLASQPRAPSVRPRPPGVGLRS